MHICHVSCPESVEIINKAKWEINITCGVTPHHLLWTNEKLCPWPEGLMYKMNPPLRDRYDQEKLQRDLFAGRIDWIESDHARHGACEKIFSPYLSGYPSLELYSYLVDEFLPSIGFKEEKIKKITHDNIYKIFGNKLDAA